MTTPSDPVFDLHRGSAALLLSIPHLGARLPAELAEGYTPVADEMRDTDWHLDRLYGFASGLGASVLTPRYSRYAIDLNRPPDGQSLYPGQTTTGLCPTETFRGEPLYRDGRQPDAAATAHRLATYWQPYHDALAAELERLRQAHGAVLLWEAHSIASVLPRLFDGKLPDLNFGTNDGASCAASVSDAVLAPLRSAGSGAPFTHAFNGRFKGGYITRHFGEPARGIHAIQLEMCQCVYMDEEPPFGFRPDLAQKVQPLLQEMLGNGLEAVRSLAGAR